MHAIPPGVASSCAATGIDPLFPPSHKVDVHTRYVGASKHHSHTHPPFPTLFLRFVHFFILHDESDNTTLSHA